MAGLSCVLGVVVYNFMGTSTCSARMYGEFVCILKAEGLKK